MATPPKPNPTTPPDRRGSVRSGPIDRRIVVLAPLAALTAILVFVAASRGTDDDLTTTAPVTAATSSEPAPSGTTSAADDTIVGVATTTTIAPTTTTTTTTTTTVPILPDDGKVSSERRLVDAFTVEDPDLQPKSIVASGDGLFFAQNMMYRHNVAIYDRAGNKVATIPDEVDLSAFGISDGPVVRGSPVEAAFTPDGRYVYVSNYKMFGDGYSSVADDECNRGDWEDSFVYKIDTASFEIVAVTPTGAVPKFLEVSPDGSTLVVSNWCGFDVSFIDTATDTEVARVDVGRHPRGVAIDKDSEVVYVTVMGEHRIDMLGLQSHRLLRSYDTDVAGTTPRHILLSDDDRYLYVSNHKMNMVRKIELSSGAVVGTAGTGTETRTMALSDDGESLYVVNYRDGTVSKVRTSDMEILQTVQSGVNPVGITYDADTRQVWVANYAGSLRVFNDQ
jgi:YVTN family beta-propeller protein